ncbi:hypothetical protein JF50_16330 [Pseudoalteromonas luteoviolacea]|uniref:Uncharacterized protein n=1 Tax=Pseudoalteromonas luteoviolacea TaxID=43657 RepID=A0A0C1QLF3_9GAMM|nr:hypothetical protein [Pseudoalteromonas luteoviolacea]KID55907.1 hypothetical protein JF50_16330 [Pseudoalteromonas luteoviolacea]
MRNTRTIQFELYTHTDPLFPIGKASALDEIEFEVQGNELVLDCLLPSDATSGNTLVITSTHLDARYVNFSGSVVLDDLDIVSGSVELILKGSGEAGTYMTQLSLLGETGGVKNIVDAQVELACSIYSKETDTATYQSQQPFFKILSARLTAWKNELINGLALQR